MFDSTSLNEQQRVAVSTTEGAVLILAGAGTGKTRVLSSRVVNIVTSGLCPLDEILVVTFTTKSAHELVQRTVDLLESNGCSVGGIDNLWIGTFHSIALRIIRPLCDYFNRKVNFEVIKNSEQLRIINQLLKSNGLPEGKFDSKDILSYITSLKESLHDYPCPKNSMEYVAVHLVDAYEKELVRLNVIDFSDILKISLDIFNSNPGILNYYQQKFKYIMIDEYQDTNISQYAWLKLLAIGHGNICCVGDDDQSIYTWRGADIRNILNFKKDFQQMKLIKLEHNYRSTANILKSADCVIVNNKFRIDKVLKTDAESGLPIMIVRTLDPTDEAQVLSNIIAIKVKHGYSYSDFAILARTSVQLRAFEDVFMTSDIPYILSDGIQFYERTEVKDVIAYLKLLVNPNDEIALKRVINVPKRGIGTATLLKLHDLATKRDLPISDAAMISDNKRLIAFFEMLATWQFLSHTLPLQKLVEKILHESGYIKMINSTHDNDEKLIILDDLMLVLEQYVSVRDFLDYINLATDDVPTNKKNGVYLSTIHAAKGLEYRVVFIPGLEEGILPHQKSLKKTKGLEEERRLFYVALTRARKEVFISFCDKRPIYGMPHIMGNRLNTQISRFVTELPQDCIHWVR